jgi:hypothetical protein
MYDTSNLILIGEGIIIPSASTSIVGLLFGNFITPFEFNFQVEISYTTSLRIAYLLK